MLNDDGDDSPEKCRERRRRRIEMRRLASGGSSQPIDPLTSKEKKQAAAGESSSSTSTEGKRVVETVCEIPVAEPVFGSMSVSGRSREMEDAISVRINFFQPEVNRRRPVHLFGVFDGHGGAHVIAENCPSLFLKGHYGHLIMYLYFFPLFCAGGSIMQGKDARVDRGRTGTRGLNTRE
jgi:protein phosphatase 2C